MDRKQVLLRKLPAISLILEHPGLKEMSSQYPHTILAEAASETVQAIRAKLLRDDCPEAADCDLDTIVGAVIARINEKSRPKLRKVVNATGIILHTNLGRAVLARAAVDAVHDIAGSYSNLELDLESGERGSRYSHIDNLLCRLTGAEAGIVVNNNAAAVLLVLNTLARDREAIVSRGQLVEIGGSFRIPDVMVQSGVKLVEVGTTNKTHLWDYERAVTEDTAVLLKVHTSNYRVIGFTSEVTARELADLGREREIPVVEDLGSGVLVDFDRFGITHEPTVRESIAAGVDIVTCSGDKLFGGPQAGIIVGREDLIKRIKKNPLTRALRVDKFTLAAMEATLSLYLDEERAIREIPTLKMISMTREELCLRADTLCRRITGRLGARGLAEVVEGFSQVGGGALPEENIPTCLVSVQAVGLTVNGLEEKLRSMNPPVLARIQRDRLLLDPRTLLEGDDEVIVNHLAKILEGSEEN